MRTPVIGADEALAVTTQRSSFGLLPFNKNEPSYCRSIPAPLSDLNSGLSSRAHLNSASSLAGRLSNHLPNRPGNASRSHLASAWPSASASTCHLAKRRRVSSGLRSTSISLRIVVAKVVIMR